MRKLKNQREGGRGRGATLTYHVHVHDHAHGLGHGERAGAGRACSQRSRKGFSPAINLRKRVQELHLRKLNVSLINDGNTRPDPLHECAGTKTENCVSDGVRGRLPALPMPAAGCGASGKGLETRA